MAKNQLANQETPDMQEMQVQPLCQEDPLEKEMETHSSILPGRSHENKRLAGYSP